MKTLMPKQISGEERKWYIIDAEGKNLGRLATALAAKISGKDRVDFAGHVDNGDYIIVTNADKIAVTGNKEEDKEYHTHSGYMGNLKTRTVKQKRATRPTDILRLAVFGMLPKTKHRKNMTLRLKLCVGTKHQFAAQQPVELTF